MTTHTETRANANGRPRGEKLATLVSKRGRWISKEELSVAILGHPPRAYDDSTLRVHLSRVRRLLGDRGQLIQSRRQRGWRWADPAPMDQHR